MQKERRRRNFFEIANFESLKSLYSIGNIIPFPPEKFGKIFIPPLFVPHPAPENRKVHSPPPFKKFLKIRPPPPL